MQTLVPVVFKKTCYGTIYWRITARKRKWLV